MSSNEFASRVREVPEMLFSLAPTAEMIVFDGDHVLWDEGIISQNGELKIEEYSETSRDNFQQLAQSVLDGKVTVISTGKGVNAYPVGRHMYNIIAETLIEKGWATRENNQLTFDHQHRDKITGRPINDEGKPLFFVLSVGNGGEWYDLMDPIGGAYSTELSTNILECIADPFIAHVIHKSTDPSRWETLQRVTPEHTKPDDFQHTQQQVIRYEDFTAENREPDLVRSLYRDELIHRIGMDVCVLPKQTKLNLVLNIDRILNGKIKVADIPDHIKGKFELDASIQVVSLQDIWRALTGITITDGGTLFDAVRVLIPDEATMFHAHANHINYLDIGMKSKGTNVKEIQDVVKEVYKKMGLKEPTFQITLAEGDGIRPTSNDASMIYDEDVIGVTNKVNKYRHYPNAPIELPSLVNGQVLSDTQYTNKLLHAINAPVVLYES